jgi:hypothetical protein
VGIVRELVVTIKETVSNEWYPYQGSRHSTRVREGVNATLLSYTLKYISLEDTLIVTTDASVYIREWGPGVDGHLCPPLFFYYEEIKPELNRILHKSQIHWVTWGIGTPKDRVEPMVNRRKV